MARSIRSMLAIGALSLLVLGGVLTASAAYTANDEGSAAGNAWQPKSADWPQFRQNAQKTGLTPATATMKLAYYKWSARTNGPVYASPSVANLRTAYNNTDVVVGSYDGRLYCINGMNGNIRWRYQAGSSIYSSPAIGDLNDDGQPEVVFGCNDGRIYAVNGADGTLIWRYTTRSLVISSPLIADINGDGKMEAVVGSYDGRVYALNGAGARVWIATTPLGRGAMGVGIQAPPAAGDINGDGKMEIIMPAGDGVVYALAGADGSELWNFSTGVNGILLSTAAIGDLDGDKAMEIFVAGGADSMAYSLSGKDGKEKWSTLIGSAVSSSPAVGDGDGDGDSELYFGTDSNQFICLDGVSGTVEWRRQYTNPVLSSPALADTDGDKNLEVVIGGTDRVLRSLNAEDGSPSWAYPAPNGIQSSPAVVDIDNDGKAEIVFGCMDGRVYAVDYNF